MDCIKKGQGPGPLGPPARCAPGSSKNGARLQNSSPFERSACFYVTMTKNFERYLYFNFETNQLKNENLFQKTRVLFFS